MPRVLSDNVWVDGVLHKVGEVPPPEVAARIGDHAWTTIDDDPAPVEGGTEPQAEVGSEPTVTIVMQNVAPNAESVPPEAPETPPSVGDEPPADGSASAEEPAPESGDDIPEAPPRAGRGASKDAWAKYAEARGVTVPADASRDDIIAAVDAAN